jgi:hypothetical protein
MAEYAITWSPLDDLFPSQELVYRWLHAYIQHHPVHGYLPVSYRISRLSLLRSLHYTESPIEFAEAARRRSAMRRADARLLAQRAADRHADAQAAHQRLTDLADRGNLSLRQ